MNIFCKFKIIQYGDEDFYTATVDCTQIKTRIGVGSFKGRHTPGLKNDNVQAVWFENTFVEFLPKGLSEIFPNLVALSIIGCDLQEIKREDFCGLENLTNIYIHGNPLKTLPDDLFHDMTKLKEVSFMNNKLEVLSSKLLEPLEPNLEFVDFSGNTTINSFYCKSIYGSVGSVKELMEIIDKQCHRVEVKIETEDPFKNILFNGFQNLWKTKQLADLVIITDAAEFNVHKNILAIQSPVFAEMFEKDRFRSEVRFQSFSKEAVEMFLKYLYTSEMPEPDYIIEVFKLSFKLKVQTLGKKCEDFIVENINASNAFRSFILGRRYESERIKTAGFNMIQKSLHGVKLNENLMEEPKKLKELLDASERYKRKIQEAEEEFEKVKRTCNM